MSPNSVMPDKIPPNLSQQKRKTTNDHKHGEDCLLTNITLLINIIQQTKQSSIMVTWGNNTTAVFGKSTPANAPTTPAPATNNSAFSFGAAPSTPPLTSTTPAVNPPPLSGSTVTGSGAPQIAAAAPTAAAGGGGFSFGGPPAAPTAGGGLFGSSSGEFDLPSSKLIVCIQLIVFILVY